MVPQRGRVLVVSGDPSCITSAAIGMLLDRPDDGMAVVIVDLPNREPVLNVAALMRDIDVSAGKQQYPKAPRMTRAEAKRQNRAMRRK